MAVKKQVSIKQGEEGDKVALFKLLADMSRYRVLALLVKSKTPLCVNEICAHVGMTHSSVSHILGKLHSAEVVAYKKSGREAHYSLAKTSRARQVTKLV